MYYQRTCNPLYTYKDGRTFTLTYALITLYYYLLNNPLHYPALQGYGGLKPIPAVNGWEAFTHSANFLMSPINMQKSKEVL